MSLASGWRMRCAVLACAAFGAMVGEAKPASAASAILAWDANTETDVLGYRVYYDLDTGAPYEGTDANEGASPIEILIEDLDDPEAPGLTLTGLTSCTRYYFAVTAFSPGGESAFSGEIPSTVVATPNPVVITPGDGSLALSWSGIPDDDAGTIEGYTVSYDTDAGEPYEGAGSPVTVPNFAPETPSFTLEGLDNGTTYYLVVEAHCPDETIKTSDEVSGAPEEGASTTSVTTGAGAGGGGEGGSAGPGAGGDATGPAGSGGGADAPEEDAGCACRAAGSPDADAAGFVTGLALAGAALARRRRRASRGG